MDWNILKPKTTLTSTKPLYQNLWVRYINNFLGHLMVKLNTSIHVRLGLPLVPLTTLTKINALIHLRCTFQTHINWLTLLSLIGAVSNLSWMLSFLVSSLKCITTHSYQHTHSHHTNFWTYTTILQILEQVSYSDWASLCKVAIYLFTSGLFNQTPLADWALSLVDPYEFANNILISFALFITNSCQLCL